MDDNLPKAIKQLNLDPQTEKMFRRCLNLEYRFMFFYGTDTPEQLELKFGQKLTRLGAILPEHVLAFGGPDESWSARNDGRKGGPSIVDTRWCSGLTPAEAQRLPGVPGYVAFVSPQHFRMLWNLNALEYDIRSVQPVIIRTPSGRTDPIPAQAFVRRQMDWSGGGPADACMCATLRLIKQHASAFPGTLAIRNETGRLVYKWSMPGFKELPLPAFLYEVGSRKTPKPWAMPKTIDQVCAKLLYVGYDPLRMDPETFVRKIDEINRKLQEHGKPVIGDSVVEIAKRLLRQVHYTTSLARN